MSARQKLFNFIEPASGKSFFSSFYDYFTIVVIVASLVPLAFKETNLAFEILDWVCVGIFAVDYLLRWITADYKFGKRGFLSFLRYPFSFMALIDLISILPSVTALNQGFKLLRIFRLLRAFRVFRVFKAFRYSKNIKVIVEVLKKSRNSLASVGTLAIGYVLVSALIIFNVEPDSFDSFFNAVYWATISLTTVGYGDIYAVSVAGQVVTMISSLFGIAIIALPSGIITAGYMRAIGEPKNGKAVQADDAQRAEPPAESVPAEGELQEKEDIPAPQPEEEDTPKEDGAPEEDA